MLEVGPLGSSPTLVIDLLVVLSWSSPSLAQLSHLESSTWRLTRSLTSGHTDLLLLYPAASGPLDYV